TTREPQRHTRAAVIIGVSIIIATIIGVWAFRNAPALEEKPIIAAPETTTPPRIAETKSVRTTESQPLSQTTVDVSPPPATTTAAAAAPVATKAQAAPAKTTPAPVEPQPQPRHIEPATTTHEAPPPPA